ncbi:MAG: methylenetetrahydrofolate reductase C-terminal domain-containing protein [Chloroflexi bacterium]|nr:methylenetetrahydrofolate reductase C-terminal domain-containing protein [Chloroflexota bacterium]
MSPPPRRFGRWLQKHPRTLEKAYDVMRWGMGKARPLIAKLGYERLDKLMGKPEQWGKELIFDCRMCGQCILHSTGMTCPMTCPKNLRNGPCGGVRANGHCEVLPEMKCVWVEAYERSLEMATYGREILLIQPPVNRQLEGKSAWVTMLTGEDVVVPVGWGDE